MNLNVDLHNLDRAEFQLVRGGHDGDFGVARFYAGNEYIQLFTTPDVAEAIVDAFNETMREPTEAEQNLIPIPEGYAEQ